MFSLFKKRKPKKQEPWENPMNWEAEDIVISHDGLKRKKFQTMKTPDIALVYFWEGGHEYWNISDFQNISAYSRYIEAQTKDSEYHKRYELAKEAYRQIMEEETND